MYVLYRSMCLSSSDILKSSKQQVFCLISEGPIGRKIIINSHIKLFDTGCCSVLAFAPVLMLHITRTANLWAWATTRDAMFNVIDWGVSVPASLSGECCLGVDVAWHYMFGNLTAYAGGLNRLVIVCFGVCLSQRVGLHGQALSSIYMDVLKTAMDV